MWRTDWLSFDGLAELLQRNGLNILVTHNLEARALSLAPGSRRASRPLARVGSRGLLLVSNLEASRSCWVLRL